jgi:hypothetical protein
MDKSSQSAIVYITKLEAARRQVNASIRMYMTKQDDLAIHTVAAAAYRLLRELLDNRGIDDRDDLLRVGLFYLAKEMSLGTLSDKDYKTLMGDEYTQSIVSRIADTIKQHGGDVDIDDIDSIIPRASIRTSPSARRSRLEQLWKASNFLKHADRDQHGAISLDDIDNDMMIISASAAYTMVAHDITGEMAVFYALASVTSPERFEVTDSLLKELAKVLVPLSASRRRRACLRMIKNWGKTIDGT